MATSFGYRFGKVLGRVLFLAYVFAAIIGVAGSVYGIDAATQFTGWPLWIGTIVVGVLILRFVPRPFDLIILSPLAFWGAAQAWGLTYLMAGLTIGVPVAIVCLLSLGRK